MNMSVEMSWPMLEWFEIEHNERPTKSGWPHSSPERSGCIAAKEEPDDLDTGQVR